MNAAATFVPDVTLDALFRRNAITRAQSLALVDPAGATYTYAEAANVIDDLAAQVTALNLPSRSSVALLLPNGGELALTLLAVLRAGHVPVPMPVAWRKSDLVRACREAEAAALITTAHFSAENLPQLAAEVAIEVFELSFPCAFGAPLPDGIVPLSLNAAAGAAPAVLPSGASSAGIGTLQAENSGVAFVLHRDEELLAAGLGAMLAADIQSGDRIVSALSLSSFAGLASAFVPWLLSGGTLVPLADARNADTPGTDAAERSHLVAPAGSLAPVCQLLEARFASATAVHFAGAVLDIDYSGLAADRVVDVFALHELCAIPLRRVSRSSLQPIPLGAIHAGAPGAMTPVILETRVGETGNIFIRGAMVPRERIEAQDWLDTGYAALPCGPHACRARAPAGTVAIGALRFCFPELERRILAAALVSRVEIAEDRVLGNRLVIVSERPEETAHALMDAGLPRVIANAVRKGEAARARFG